MSWLQQPASTPLPPEPRCRSTVSLTLRDLAQFLESQLYMYAVFTNDEVARVAGVGKPATSRTRRIGGQPR